jgi:hypothetical protein
MKKVLAILTLALFIGGISAPAIASVNSTATAIELADKDPKKKDTKKSEKKADCETKKASNCETKKSDCSKSCGGSSK